jgi:hypothetical protein
MPRADREMASAVREACERRRSYKRSAAFSREETVRFGDEADAGLCGGFGKV